MCSQLRHDQYIRYGARLGSTQSGSIGMVHACSTETWCLVFHGRCRLLKMLVPDRKRWMQVAWHLTMGHDDDDDVGDSLSMQACLDS